MRHLITAALLSLAFTATGASAQSDPPSYRNLAPIALPDGRWDLLSVDTAHHRVLIGRSDSLDIVDLDKGVVKSVGTVSRGHAAVAIEGTNLVAITSGGDNSVRLIDATSGEQTASIAVGQNPDAAFYDAASKRLIVMNATGGTVSIVDPATASVARTVTVKPALELGTLIAPDMLAINDEDAGEIELVDLTQGLALPPIVLTGCEGPTGIAFDQADGLLLSACANGQAALVDARAHRLIELLPIGRGADGALFDPQRRRFMVPCGQTGTLVVFGVDADRHVTALDTVPTELGARTATLDPVSGRIYLPAATFAAPPSAGGRPTQVAGSAHLIVLEPS
ncbi:MAG: YncE family protein [Croceibacterium sp.]